ncbi:MAG TPA: amidase [Pyrinomonadaceae bacterium]|jgi:Asp-tRNA(Asn)/Glu-tRNA(Gln) amidotransferase A subunit family amidase|nr:amidase [Pyrinomonadaceae bacterium]
MDELVEQSLGSIRKMIRQREVSPVEVAEAHLERIARLNPQLNAIVTLAPDVVERAKAAEAALLRGDEVGSLHGVPVTVKDTIDTAGLRTTSGSKIRMDYVPETDAPAVARLKAAGAIVLGKTNAAEMAMDYNADNLVFGRTNHHLNAGLTPGGSSGGEAVAIATCMSPGGIGSDLAGSVRIPAHFCGICGLKPTTGRIPGELQFPPSIGPYSLGAVIGPMARHVGDLRLLLGALSKDPFERSSFDLRGVRVAWYTDDGVAPVTEETAKAVATAARALSDAGLIVQEQRPPHVDRGNEMWLKVFSRASVVQLRSVYKGREGEGGSFVRWRLGTADVMPAPTLDEYIASWMERDRLREELLQWMETTPIILAPVGATPAYPHDTLKVTVHGLTFGTFRAFSYAQTFSVFDLPTVTVPVGRSNEGLPIGVQIAGTPFAEEMVLAAAEIVEKSV